MSTYVLDKKLPPLPPMKKERILEALNTLGARGKDGAATYGELAEVMRLVPQDVRTIKSLKEGCALLAEKGVIDKFPCTKSHAVRVYLV